MHQEKNTMDIKFNKYCHNINTQITWVTGSSHLSSLTAEHPSLILIQGARDLSHYQIWMPVLKSPWLKATTWTENQQENHHNSFLINLQGENHRKAVIGSLLVPHHTLVLSFGLLSYQSHWLLLWRLWLQLLSFNDLIIWAKLHLSQDFCINPKKLQAVKKKKKGKEKKKKRR